ncbi:MAG: hypothetical protein EHM40_12845 [Chloroflexi bacterium]|nr:MAG: hypothetical protein EHM40_12845 [Chloroflexota bacterium]
MLRPYNYFYAVSEPSNILVEIKFTNITNSPILATPPIANIVRIPQTSATNPASAASMGPIPQIHNGFGGYLH